MRVFSTKYLPIIAVAMALVFPLPAMAIDFTTVSVSEPVLPVPGASSEDVTVEVQGLPRAYFTVAWGLESSVLSVDRSCLLYTSDAADE